MYTKDKYTGKNQKEIINILYTRGFEPKLIVDEPGAVYESHFHPETKLLVFLKGSMDVTIGNENFHCLPGDEVLIVGNTEHGGKVGSEGCEYLWSEKIF